MICRSNSDRRFAKVTLLGFGAAALGFSAIATAAAAQPPSKKAAFAAVSVTSAYWTPARLAAAKPLVMSSKAAFGSAPESAPAAKPSTPVPGAPPTVAYDPAFAGKFNLFPQAAGTEGAVAPALVGTFGYPYTVNRLYPDPDLYKIYPYSTVGQLFFTIPGLGDFVCSASVVRHRVIATAGHCVSDGNGHFYSNWVFIPGRNGANQRYGQWTWELVTTTANWHFGGGGVPNVQDDALIVLIDRVISGTSRKIGNLTGTLGYQFEAALPTHITQIGYPCNLDGCARPIATNAEPRSGPSNNYEWGTAQFGGSSGGPEAQDFGRKPHGTPAQILGGNIVISVTSYGYTDPAVQVDGGSILKPAGFPGHGFGDLINLVCGIPGNC